MWKTWQDITTTHAKQCAQTPLNFPTESCLLYLLFVSHLDLICIHLNELGKNNVIIHCFFFTIPIFFFAEENKELKMWIRKCDAELDCKCFDKTCSL